MEENWEKHTFFIQDGGYLFTNKMSGGVAITRPANAQLTFINVQISK